MSKTTDENASVNVPETDMGGDSVDRAISTEEMVSMRKGGMKLSEIARLAGMTKQGVSLRLKRSGVPDVQAIEQFKKDKPLLLHAKQKMVLDSITQPVIDKMSGRDRFIALGITQDKIRDLESPKGGVSGETWLAVLRKVHQERPEEKDVTPKKEGEDG